MLNIISGRSDTGKTEYCLYQYRRMLAQIPATVRPGEVLWITPTQLSVAATTQQLFSKDLSACFAPGVMTFDQFAEKVIRGAGTKAQMISASQKKMLLQSVVYQAADQQELKHFFKIHQTRGFLSQVNRLITELKRDEIWPETFRERLETTGFSHRDHDLCLLYERYQEKLLNWDRYDNEGRYWLARTLLQRKQWQAFPIIQLIVVDGFTDFTPTQQDMLIDLADHADQLLLTLPIDHADQRFDLFSITENTCQQLQQLAKSKKLKIDQIRLEANNSLTRPAGIIQLSRNLFTHPRRLQATSDQTGCQLVAALGMKAEIREVIARVKRLLIEGVSAADICITVRDLAGYKKTLQVIGADAGVPLWIMLPESVLSLPLCRSLLRWYAVIKSDWSYASLKKLLRHTPIRFKGVSDSPSAQKSVLHHLNGWNLQGGRQEILQQFSYASKKNAADQSENREVEQSPAALPDHSLTDAAALTQELDRLLKQLQKSGSYVDQTRQLLALGREYFAEEKHPSPFSAEVGNSAHKKIPLSEEWDLIARLLNEAARFQDELTQQSPAPRVSCQEYASWLEEVFRNQLLQLAPRKPHEIAVLPAEQARHLNVRYLFVLGLQEGSFPGGQETTPIYSDRERERWSGDEHKLTSREYRYREELLFFYRLLTRAQQQLTLSYSRVTTRGEPQYAATFYQQLKSLFAPAADREQTVGDLSPLPSPQQLLTFSDCRLSAVRQMRNKQPELLAWWGSLPHQNSSFFQLLSAVSMNALRFETEGWTRCEGVLRSPANIKRLQQKYNQEYTFSASRLEGYATCPYRYFLEQILEVAWQESPGLKTDYRQRGIIVHDLLSELHGLLLKQPEADSTQPGQSIISHYIELLKNRFQQQYHGTELQKALDEIEQDLLAEWAVTYSEQQQQYQERISGNWQIPPAARFREITFGKHEQDSTADENTKAKQEVFFGGPQNKVKVEGRIDRLDIGELDGRTVFNVIDYKTSSPKKTNLQALSRGTQLQLALYAVAVVRLNLLGTEAIPWAIGYWNVREKGFQPQFVNTRKKKYEAVTAEEFIQLRAKLDRVIPELVQQMRDGFYPVHNNDATCTGSCPHSTVCRVNQVRSVAERLHKTWGEADSSLNDTDNDNLSEAE